MTEVMNFLFWLAIALSAVLASLSCLIALTVVHKYVLYLIADRKWDSTTPQRPTSGQTNNGSCDLHNGFTPHARRSV